MIRVRHYTRVSAMRLIIRERCLRARDQNKVFVELADARRLSPVEAEAKYGLGRGKGNACIEFNVALEELQTQYNARMKRNEQFIVGGLDLSGRDFEAMLNI